ncbi:MAG: GNAT family N-acetyltransferase [Burkholderiales bacterium]|nr:GNAT family N-acetyltransferase [Burkholderiales bacterium]
MSGSCHFAIDAHDEYPATAAASVDTGIGAFNDIAAPLHEVAPVACFARRNDGTVIGGAIGRRWGKCCEVQQLWVDESHRRQGIGVALMRAFESRAREHGCEDFFLETFSFQAPDFYRALGYVTVHKNDLFPHGIVKHLMFKRTSGAADAAPEAGSDQVATLPRTK